MYIVVWGKLWGFDECCTDRDGFLKGMLNQCQLFLSAGRMGSVIKMETSGLEREHMSMCRMN